MPQGFPAEEKPCIFPFLKRAAGFSFALFAALLLLNPSSAMARDPDESMLPEAPRPEVQEILDYYPAGSIDSRQTAEEALEVVRVEKENIKARLFNEQLECNKKFFVYWCYEEAEKRKRVDYWAIHALEVEANRVKRSEEVRQRDLALDKQRVEFEADRKERVANLADYEEQIRKNQEKLAEQEAAAKGITATPDKKHRGNLMTPAEKEQNVAEFEQKQIEAEERMERVLKKRAETQRKREMKAADEEKERREQEKKEKELKEKNK